MRISIGDTFMIDDNGDLYIGRSLTANNVTIGNQPVGTKNMIQVDGKDLTDIIAEAIETYIEGHNVRELTDTSPFAKHLMKEILRRRAKHESS